MRHIGGTPRIVAVAATPVGALTAAVAAVPVAALAVSAL